MSVRNWAPVRNCMRPDITEIDGKMDVWSALRTMRDVSATSLIVKRSDENDEYGMLLFTDIAMKVIAKNRAPERVSVYEIMTKPCVTVHPDMEIRHCARLFENIGIGHAPVVEKRNIVGIISYYRLVLHGLMPELGED